MYLDSEIAAHFPDAYRVGPRQVPITDGLLRFRGTRACRSW